MRSLILYVALASLSLDASAACSEHAVTSFVSRFYQTGNHPSVPPSKPDLELLRPLLSARLFEAFDAAKTYQAKWIAMHPSEPSPNGGPLIIYKPPFVDGDIFTGSPDGATTFEVTDAVRDDAGAWRVRITALPQPRMSTWSVVVVVIPEGEVCVIDDVLYDDGTQTSPATLSEYLRYRKD